MKAVFNFWALLLSCRRDFCRPTWTWGRGKDPRIQALNKPCWFCGDAPYWQQWWSRLELAFVHSVCTEGKCGTKSNGNFLVLLVNANFAKDCLSCREEAHTCSVADQAVGDVMVRVVNEVLVKVVNMRICLRSSISRLGGWKQSHFALWGKLSILYVILELMYVWVLRWQVFSFCSRWILLCMFTSPSCVLGVSVPPTLKGKSWIPWPIYIFPFPHFLMSFDHPYPFHVGLWREPGSAMSW